MRGLVVAALALLVVSVVSAHAADPYVTAKAGGAWTKLKGGDLDGVKVRGYGGSVGLGYAFDSGFRVEAELGAARVEASKHSVSAKSFGVGLNALYVYPEAVFGVHPFAGVGVGHSWVSGKGVRKNNESGFGVGGGLYIRSTTTTRYPWGTRGVGRLSLPVKAFTARVWEYRTSSSRL